MVKGGMTEADIMELAIPTKIDDLWVLVCGGRYYDNWELVKKALDEIQPFGIIEGGATGADALASRWAKENLPKERHQQFKAEWTRYGRSMAGAIRNQQMLEEGRPKLVVAFPGGNGTADMIKRAKLARVEVREITRRG